MTVVSGNRTAKTHRADRGEIAKTPNNIGIRGLLSSCQTGRTRKETKCHFSTVPVGVDRLMAPEEPNPGGHAPVRCWRNPDGPDWLRALVSAEGSPHASRLGGLERASMEPRFCERGRCTSVSHGDNLTCNVLCESLVDSVLKHLLLYDWC